MLKISFTEDAPSKSGALVTAVLSDGRMTSATAELDKRCKGALKRAMAAADFTGKKGKMLEVLAPAGIDNGRVLLVGIGEPSELTAAELVDQGGSVVAQLLEAGESEAALLLTSEIEGAPEASARAASLAYGAMLRSYRFDKYKTKEKAEDKPKLSKLTLHVADKSAAKKAFAPLEAIAKGVERTRDLVSEPANVIYPKSFVAEAKKLEKLGVAVSVLGEKEMKKLGMGSLLGVAQGSVREPQLLVLEWRGAAEAEAAPLAICGKGVTFDTGGISIKPAANMDEMKADMSGAAAVIGAMRAIASLGLGVKVTGWVPAAENMPSGTAQRPGDVLTTYSGTTVEVLNTDAEGRLVLADALGMAVEDTPDLIVDVATLTGAQRIALGSRTAGVMANNDDARTQVIDAASAAGEAMWPMPLPEDLRPSLDSATADIANIGDRLGGMLSAGIFLSEFIPADQPWVHIDIAGPAFNEKSAYGYTPKGGTGAAVRTFVELVEDFTRD